MSWGKWAAEAERIGGGTEKIGGESQYSFPCGEQQSKRCYARVELSVVSQGDNRLVVGGNDWLELKYFLGLAGCACPYCRQGTVRVRPVRYSWQVVEKGRVHPVRYEADVQLWTCGAELPLGDESCPWAVVSGFPGVSWTVGEHLLVLDDEFGDSYEGNEESLCCGRGESHYGSLVQVQVIGGRRKLMCVHSAGDVLNIENYCGWTCWIGRRSGFPENDTRSHETKYRVIAALGELGDASVAEVVGASGLRDSQVQGCLHRLVRARLPLVELGQSQYHYSNLNMVRVRRYRLTAAGKYWLGYANEEFKGK